MSAVAGAPVSRRELLLRPARRTFAQADDDARLVAELLLLERVAIASYDVAVAAARALPQAERRRRGRGRPPLPRLLARLRDQERDHAEVLASKLQELGGRALAGPDGPGALRRLRRQLGLTRPLDGLRGERALVAFALELENAQLRRCLEAVRDLRDARLVELALQVMGAEGQHAVVLRSVLTDAPALLVPGAFERGVAAVP